MRIDRRGLLAGAAALAAARPALAQATPLRIAVSSTTLAYGGLQIAAQAGLFRDQGLDLHITVMDSGSTAITALLSGSVDLSAAGPGEALAARAHEQPIVIIVNIYRGLSGSLLLSKAAAAAAGVAPDGDIAARLRALKGLVIAAPSATSAYTLPFRSASAAVGAPIKFVYMAQPAMGAALSAGAVQGIIAGAPFSTVPVENGSGVLWISGPGRGLPAADSPASSACLQATESFVRDHPDTIRKLRAVFASLTQLITTQPAQALTWLEKAYPQIPPATLATVFRQESANWASTEMTAADIAQEIAIQKLAGVIAGVGAIAPASMLAKGS